MCCLGECLGEWAERSDSLSESPCSLTRVGRLQYTGGLTNTAKANATVSNGSTPYKKCSCPYELFEQRTYMVSWFHLMSLVIFHLISVEAGDHMCSLFEKLIWTWAFFVRDWLTLRTRWSCSTSFLRLQIFPLRNCWSQGRQIRLVPLQLFPVELWPSWFSVFQSSRPTQWCNSARKM